MSSKNLPLLQLSAENMTAEEQYAAWQTCVTPIYNVQPRDTSHVEKYNAESTWYLLDNVVMTETFASESLYSRNQKWLSRYDDADHMVFHLYLQGKNSGVNGDRVFTSGVGDITAVDMRKEVKAHAMDCKILSTIIPRDLVKGADKINGVTLASGSARSKLLTEHMLTLWKSLPEINVNENHIFSQSLIELTSTLFTQGDLTQTDGSLALDNTLISSMKNYIEKNLSSAQLGTDILCKSFHCSRATLYRLFQPYGGVASYIRERRMTSSFKELVKPSSANRRIIDIAMKYGFNNQSTFSRLFRQYFGVSPSDVISLQNISQLPNGSSINHLTAERIAQWLKVL